jgi:pimeloyl-ACP methyl ester carboxylesterase
MPEKSVNGTTLFYEERGAGLPVVLMHGFPLDGRIWSGQLDALSKQYRVIVPDLRGFGKSKSNTPFTIKSLAEDICALLRSIDATPCVLGGLSMGGYVALAFIKEYQSDLRGLMLIDTRAEGDTAEGKAGRQKMIDLARTSGSRAVADQMMPKMLAQSPAKDQPGVAQQLQQIMEACPPLTIEHALAAMRDREDYTAFLPSISVPTLIVVGEDDAITPPKLAEAMNQQIPRSSRVVIPGAGHMSPMEKPADVTRAMQAFLQSLPTE